MIVGKIKLILVAPTSLDINEFRLRLKADNYAEIEQWLNGQNGTVMMLEYHI